MTSSNSNISSELSSLYLKDDQILADLCKTYGHQCRIKILILLLQEPKDFNFFLKTLKIKKTALANHLAILKTNRLIDQHKKGNYSLSVQGYTSISSLILLNQKIALLEGKNSINSYFACKSFFAQHQLESNFVSPVPKFEKSSLTYLGAVLGIVKSFGLKFTLEDIGGYSGYSFRITVDKNSTHVAGPTAEPFWDDIYRGTEELVGRKLNVIFNPRAFFPFDQLTLEEKELIQDVMNKIKHQINSNNPVILWGIVAPEFGIVYGYNNDHIFASTFQDEDNNISIPFNIYQIVSPSGIWLMYLDSNDRLFVSQKELDQLALKRAIKIIEGMPESTFDEAWEIDNKRWTGKNVEFICGLRAFDAWANILEFGKDKQFSYDGNSYCGHCYCQGMYLSSEFLKKLAFRYEKNIFSQFLHQASINYAKAYEKMILFTQLFPFSKEKLVTKELRIIGAKYLKECKSELTEGLIFIKKALERFD